MKIFKAIVALFSAQQEQCENTRLTSQIAFAMDADFLFPLGSEVKDSITGFKGIVTARCQWLNACNTYGVQSQELSSSNDVQSRVYFDQPQLILLKNSLFKSQRATGGPEKFVPETNR